MTGLAWLASTRDLRWRWRLLLADEPTAHRDRVRIDRILALLRSTVTAGRLAIVASHDDRLLAIADRVVDPGTPAPLVEPPPPPPPAPLPHPPLPLES